VPAWARHLKDPHCNNVTSMASNLRAASPQQHRSDVGGTAHRRRGRSFPPQDHGRGEMAKFLELKSKRYAEWYEQTQFRSPGRDVSHRGLALPSFGTEYPTGTPGRPWCQGVLAPGRTPSSPTTVRNFMQLNLTRSGFAPNKSPTWGHGHRLAATYLSRKDHGGF